MGRDPGKNGGGQDLPSPGDLLRFAGQASPNAPPATLDKDSERTGMLSVRITVRTLDELARVALATGKTQKVLICEGLQAIGLRVGPADLRNRPPKRRGG